MSIVLRLRISGWSIEGKEVGNKMWEVRESKRKEAWNSQRISGGCMGAQKIGCLSRDPMGRA
jgi:hypothetical protein